MPNTVRKGEPGESMDHVLTWETGEKADSEEMRQFIGFTIGDAVFGVDIMSVHEVIRSASLISVPNAPDYVAGLMMLGGNIFPLIDLRKKIYPSQAITDPGDSWIIVLEIQGRLTGIRVDSVTRVYKISRDSIEPGASGKVSPMMDDRYIAATFSRGEQLIILPDFGRIFFDHEK